MERDRELVKHVLLRVEARDHGEPNFSIPGYDDKTVSCHVAILKEAGLIDAIVHKSMDGTLEGIPIRMTWEGHEWLDLARNNRTWKNTRRLVKEKTGSVSFEIMKAILTKMAKELVLPGQQH
jgi:hypothetical protein